MATKILEGRKKQQKNPKKPKKQQENLKGFQYISRYSGDIINDKFFDMIIS